MNGGAWPEFLERFGQPGESLRARDAITPAALHRTDDGRRAEAPGEINNCRDEFSRAAPDCGVGVGEVTSVFQPASAAADGGNPQIVLREQRFHLPTVQGIAGRRKDLDGIEAVLGRFSAAGGEAVRKHKRPAAHFRDKGDGDGGAHLCGMLTSETAIRSNEDEQTRTLAGVRASISTLT